LVKNKFAGIKYTKLLSRKLNLLNFNLSKINIKG